MKSLSAIVWLSLASVAIVSLSPCQAQSTDASTTTTTSSTSADPAAGAPTDSPKPTKKTRKHRFKKQKATKAKKPKKVKKSKTKVSGKNLQGGVSRKSRHSWKSKRYSSSQQKRLDRLDSALSTPKQYTKMPELSTPGGANSTQAAPGL